MKRTLWLNIAVDVAEEMLKVAGGKMVLLVAVLFKITHQSCQEKSLVPGPNIDSPG